MMKVLTIMMSVKTNGLINNPDKMQLINYQKKINLFNHKNLNIKLYLIH